MRQAGATAPTINAAATIDDAATGLVSYAWTAGDTDSAGNFQIEWVITYPSGHKRTAPSFGYDNVVISGSLR